MSDLRTIEFTITEALGKFITRPSVALKIGIRPTEDEVYLCTDCSAMIGDNELMFLDFQEPFGGWHHVNPCSV